METVHSHIVHTNLGFRTALFCILGDPLNNLAHMRNCPGVQGRLK